MGISVCGECSRDEEHCDLDDVVKMREMKIYVVKMMVVKMILVKMW